MFKGLIASSPDSLAQTFQSVQSLILLSHIYNQLKLVLIVDKFKCMLFSADITSSRSQLLKKIKMVIYVLLLDSSIQSNIEHLD